MNERGQMVMQNDEMIFESDEKNEYLYSVREQKSYQREKGMVLWWDNKNENIGEFVFSFDGKIDYNLFSDYPSKLTDEQKEIFDKDQPYWANFFKNRK